MKVDKHDAIYVAGRLRGLNVLRGECGQVEHEAVEKVLAEWLRLKLDGANRERVAALLHRRYPKVAEKIRAGMRSSTWSEDLIDPGLLLDLLEHPATHSPDMRAE